jgi:hypothetical protein
VLFIGRSMKLTETDHFARIFVSVFFLRINRNPTDFDPHLNEPYRDEIHHHLPAKQQDQIKEAQWQVVVL